MDPLPQQSTPEAKPMTPPTPAPAEAKSSVIGIIISIIITAIVVAGATYLLLDLQTKAIRIDLEQQLMTAETAGTMLTSDLALCTKEKTALEEAALAETDEVEDPIYTTWLTYTDDKYGISWKYPRDWSTETTPDGFTTATDKNLFCVNFDGPATETRNIGLNTCYRLQTETEATTWGITGLGYNEMSKVGLDFMMADKEITEKTLFGESTSVSTIIYSQNYRDDDTNYPARMAIGDYYLTATGHLDEALTEKNGITPEEQIIMDQILASMELPEKELNN
jgi:hypothetical protein